jgi:hypothetical protein
LQRKKYWKWIVAFALIILNGIWDWMAYRIYYNCHYVSGWFVVCLDKEKLIINTVISGLAVAGALYLMTRNASVWRTLAAGMTLLIIQYLTIIYIFN